MSWCDPGLPGEESPQGVGEVAPGDQVGLHSARVPGVPGLVGAKKTPLFVTLRLGAGLQSCSFSPLAGMGGRPRRGLTLGLPAGGESALGFTEDPSEAAEGQTAGHQEGSAPVGACAEETGPGEGGQGRWGRAAGGQAASSSCRWRH